MHDIIGIRYFQSTLGSCTVPHRLLLLLGLRLGLGLGF